MKPEPWPKDAASSTARLAEVIRDIDKRRFLDREALLADFLCIAWPTIWAQAQ